MKCLKITPELALTIQLLDSYDVCIFIRTLIDFAAGEKGISPADYGTQVQKALIYWFAHIDDITITEV